MVIQSLRTNNQSNAGFGLIEIMVTISLMMIIGLGLSTMMSNMQKEQKKQTLMTVLMQLRTQFTNNITNDSSWGNTLSDATSNPHLACLRTKATCTGYTGTVYTAALDGLVLKDGAVAPAVPGVFYDGRSGSNTNGFKENGESCTGFTYGATGNDDCPIGYIVNWFAKGTSSNPSITITAKMIFNPTDKHPFKGFINALPASTNIGKYDIQVTRTATSVQRQFVAIVTAPQSATPGCLAQGYGQCATSPSWTIMGDVSSGTGSWSVSSDPYELATSVGATVVLKNPGNYKCTVAGFAFATNSARLELLKDGVAPSVGAANSTAAQATYGYTGIGFDTLVTTSVANTPLSLRYQCETAIAPAFGEPDLAYCALGFNSRSSYGLANEYRASLICVMIE